MFDDTWFYVQLACAISGYPGALLYYWYFIYRKALREQGRPPKNMLFALHLLAVPTGHIWLVMPWLPQPRAGAGGVFSMFSSSPAHVLAAVLGTAIAIYAGMYVFRFVRENLAVTLNDYSKPQKLLRVGIYAELRHPGVVANFFLVGGLSLATGAVYTLLMLPIFMSMLWITTRIEERVVLLPQFGSEYAAYSREVHGFACAKSVMGTVILAGAYYLVFKTMWA